MFLNRFLILQMEGNACWDIVKSQELGFLDADANYQQIVC